MAISTLCGSESIPKLYVVWEIAFYLSETNCPSVHWVTS